jgi:hypothetical protein
MKTLTKTQIAKQGNKYPNPCLLVHNLYIRQNKKRKKGEIVFVGWKVWPKANKDTQTYLTPVTIMVVDTISSMKSRILLKVLLDSGSATTMINRKCLPRHCQPCKISNSRKISTLTGSYILLEMVVLSNLRLHELDKNCNIGQ